MVKFKTRKAMRTNNEIEIYEQNRYHIFEWTTNE